MALKTKIKTTRKSYKKLSPKHPVKRAKVAKRFNAHKRSTGRKVTGPGAFSNIV